MEMPDDLCPRPDRVAAHPTRPHVPPIYLSSVYECGDPAEADALLAGRQPGYVYARDGHPNADLLTDKCRALHGTDCAAVTASGMGALALLVLSQLQRGDHVVVSNQLYGRTQLLMSGELARLGIDSTTVDACEPNAVRAAMRPQTRLVLVETISNPLLRVADLAALADAAHTGGAALAADNTLAGPTVCRPADWGADWVMESLTKTMNGHSDVVLGLLCGPADRWQRVPLARSTWGLAAAPFDCWLALRGLGTLGLRSQRACDNALAVARALTTSGRVSRVCYPGLPEHPDHAIARRQFGERFGSIVTFTLADGADAAGAFMAGAADIPFCPSLGELSTTLSHPASTSHRALDPAARSALGIDAGTIRLSLGIESVATVVARVQAGLAAIG